MVTTWLPHIQIMCKIPCAENSPISLHGIWSSAPFLLMHVSVMAQASHHIPPVKLLLNYQVSKTVHLFAILSETDFNLCMQNDQVYFLWKHGIFCLAWNETFKKWHTDQSDSKLTTTIRPLIFQLNAILLASRIRKSDPRVILYHKINFKDCKL